MWLESRGEQGMKRWTLRILLCLILGAVTTVAVAWAIWWFAVPREAFIGRVDMQTFSWSPSPLIEDIEGDSLASRPPPAELIRIAVADAERMERRFEPFPVAPVIMTGTAAKWVILECPVYWGEWSSTVNFRTGWPSNSMTRRRIWTGHDEATTAAYDLVLALSATHFDGEDVPKSLRTEYFPTLPIMPGFLLDTLFYAAIWGGAFFGFASAKRAIRRRRGRCPRCGYDLRGHRHEGTEARRHEGLAAGCPECGWNRPKDTP
jgi:hypothetical protein